MSSVDRGHGNKINTLVMRMQRIKVALYSTKVTLSPL